MKPWVVLAAAFAIALAGPAYANIYNRYVAPGAGGSVVVSGLVTANGHVDRGSGFSVSRVGVGEYSIDFKSGTFQECAGMTVTSAREQAIAVVVPRICQPTTHFLVLMYENGSAAPVDSAFQFIAASQSG